MCLFNILHRLRPRLRPIKYRLRNIASYASLQYTASLASTSATATFPIFWLNSPFIQNSMLKYRSTYSHNGGNVIQQ